MYPTYLIHFNKNHSNYNGQFTSGDGDGDGIRDDHHHYKQNTQSQDDIQLVNTSTLRLIGGLGKWTIGKIFSSTKFGKGVNMFTSQIKANSNIDKAFEKTNWKNYKRQKENEFYEKAASFINEHGKNLLT